jgi:hypothetical protein
VPGRVHAWYQAGGIVTTSRNVVLRVPKTPSVHVNGMFVLVEASTQTVTGEGGVGEQFTRVALGRAPTVFLEIRTA